MSIFENKYKELLRYVALHGKDRESRAGKTRQVFGGGFVCHSLEHGRFPILTSRKMYPNSVFGELAAFLKGATDLKQFQDFGCNYWNGNAKAWAGNSGVTEETDLKVGKIYGAQWRNWTAPDGTLDQVKLLIKRLKADPLSRRHLLTTYNPAEQELGCLPPCHLMTQFNVEAPYIDIMVYMRSVDLCLGFPNDMALYAALLILVGNETGYKPRTITFAFGNMHIYHNHIYPMHEYLSAPEFDAPAYKLVSEANTSNFKPSDLALIDYQHGPKFDFILNV